MVSIAEDPPEPEESSGIHNIYFVVEPIRDQLIEIAGSVDGGELSPWIDSVFPLEEVPAAFARSMERGARDKVVLRVGDG